MGTCIEAGGFEAAILYTLNHKWSMMVVTLKRDIKYIYLSMSFYGP